MIELKPCPFCGNEEVFVDKKYYNHAVSALSIGCRGCLVRTSEVRVSEDYAARERVAELWNARADEKPVADNRIFIKCDKCGGEIGERYWSHGESDIANDAYCSERCIYDALGIEDWSNVREG